LDVAFGVESKEPQGAQEEEHACGFGEPSRVQYIYEVEVDVIPLDVCVVFGSPYMSVRDVTITRRGNHYFMIKKGESLIINATKFNSRSLE